MIRLERCVNFCHPEFFWGKCSNLTNIMFQMGFFNSPPKIHKNTCPKLIPPLLFQKAQMGGLTVNQKRNNSED